MNAPNSVTPANDGASTERTLNPHPNDGRDDDIKDEIGFASDPTDEREIGEWKSRYDQNARKGYMAEAMYLAVHLILCILVVLGAAWYGTPAQGRAVDLANQTEITDLEFGLPQILYAWVGGLLGGTIYSTKWLIHVVARGIWNEDRRLWRLFTPHASGALALALVAMIGSGILVIVDEGSMRSVWVCFGLGFLTGYFSDNATAKLSELATTLFGASTKRNP